MALLACDAYSSAMTRGSFWGWTAQRGLHSKGEEEGDAYRTRIHFAPEMTAACTNKAPSPHQHEIESRFGQYRMRTTLNALGVAWRKQGYPLAVGRGLSCSSASDLTQGPSFAMWFEIWDGGLRTRGRVFCTRLTRGEVLVADDQ